MLKGQLQVFKDRPDLILFFSSLLTFFVCVYNELGILESNIAVRELNSAQTGLTLTKQSLVLGGDLVFIDVILQLIQKEMLISIEICLELLLSKVN